MGIRGGGWICGSIKFSLKPNLHPDVQMLFFESPKSEVKRNVQKFHFLTGRRRKDVTFKTGRSVQAPNPNVELSYLSHSYRTFALSLHLSFLAVLLHFLLQLLLLLGWAVLLLARLPASLPVQKERLELSFYSLLLQKRITIKGKGC